MSGFDAAWLALRESADSASRDDTLVDALADWARARTREQRVLRVCDLGCGSGSNLRHLGPRLPVPQAWTLVDDDRALLDLAGRVRIDGIGVQPVRADLATGLAGLFERRVDVVTASALLDLVSEHWLDDLVAHVVAADAAALFVLTYDGLMRAEPAHRDDTTVNVLFDSHQHRDKGFGPALGPEAVSRLVRRFETHGWGIRRGRSDWRLDARTARDAALLAPLVDGIALAAAEQGGAAAVVGWRGDRERQLRAGALRLVVGHEDVLALPPTQ